MAQEMIREVAPWSSTRAGKVNGEAMIGHPPNALGPGFRFHPTDEELVSCYLLRKVKGKPSFGFQPIIEIDLYNYEPSELPDLSPLKSKDKVWYFFNGVDRKFGGASRLNRATQQGYWKSTGKDRPVRHMSKTIGMRKTLVFHGGRAPNGERTDWVIYEYRLAVDESTPNAIVVQDVFVLCKLFQKSGLGSSNGTPYAPFVEEDWENDDALWTPAGGEADHDMPNGDVLRTGFINEEEMQDKQKALLFLKDSLDPQSQNIGLLSKRQEGSDDLEHLSLGLSIRPNQDDPNTSSGNRSKDSTSTLRGPSTKIMTDMSSAALEFPLKLSKAKECQSFNLIDSSNLEKSVPSGFLKFMNNLENDILNVSMDRDTLKLELSHAQKMIHTLMTRTEFLKMENEDLKRVVHGSG